MRWLKTFLMILFPLTFGLSIYWAIRSSQDSKEEERSLKAIPPLEILTFRGLIPKDVVKSFENLSRVPVTLHEVSSSDELWAHFNEGKLAFDLVTLPSFQFRAALDSGRLARLEHSKIEGWKRISADFFEPRNLKKPQSGVPEHHLLPLVWGMVGRWSKAGTSNKEEMWASHAQGAFKPVSSGKWSFEVSESFAPLLVISIGVSADSPRGTAINAFLSHLLRDESIDAMSKSFREASAIRASRARASEMPAELERLEPQYFRTFPLPTVRIDYDVKNAQRMKNYLNSKFRLKDFEWPPPSTKAGVAPAPRQKVTVDPSAGP